ncbi:hypothetical protein AYI68_g4456 [Smittium mucronatum]|uniref:Uncharacterized protein n=1 Tax=Smittium mucronatum TaxID=133383 RepID=A0A1R0GX56_9FUNG|nr:hypothetical protein AYI68_g4456 [Smittium mucronatum]
MKKRKRSIEKTIIPTTISSSAGLVAAYLRESGEIYQPKDPPKALLQVPSAVKEFKFNAAEIIHNYIVTQLIKVDLNKNRDKQLVTSPKREIPCRGLGA